jgi:hypothetical protein
MNRWRDELTILVRWNKINDWEGREGIW